MAKAPTHLELVTEPRGLAQSRYSRPSQPYHAVGCFSHTCVPDQDVKFVSGDEIEDGYNNNRGDNKVVAYLTKYP